VTSGSSTVTFPVPSTTLATSSANRNLLFGTAGIQSAGGPAPDFVLPNNFLSTSGGTISFFGTGGGAYTALPTDGIQSRIWGGNTNNLVNSPRNYSSVTGSVNPSSVPEPSSVILVPLAAGSMYWISRRRRTKLISGSA
jgi:hypothetical protein